jgi:hypothetical protein
VTQPPRKPGSKDKSLKKAPAPTSRQIPSSDPNFRPLYPKYTRPKPVTRRKK